MSAIEIRHGTATVTAESTHDLIEANGRTLAAHYRPVDVLDAACAALLAINTPDAVQLAHKVYELTALNLGARRAQPTPQGD